MQRFGSTRKLSTGLFGLALILGAAACSHGENKNVDKSDVSSTDTQSAHSTDGTDTRTTRTTHAEARIKEATNDAKVQTKKSAHRVQAAADRTAAKAPAEGSEEEYAANVDAAMGDSSNTSANASANSVASTDAGADSSAAVNPQADNSKVNRISNGVVGLSAEQQGNSKTDVEITRKIRRAIISNKSLSTYAHNVKIITRDGRVVLKGPVRSVDERRIIEDSAVTVAGADHVSSGLEIKMK